MNNNDVTAEVMYARAAALATDTNPTRRKRAKKSDGERIKWLLAILSNLKKYQVESIADLARVIKTDESVLLADLNNIQYAGIPPFGGGDLIPIEVDEDGFLNVNGDMPTLNKPIKLTEEQATSLIVALEIAGFDSEDELVQTLSRATTRGLNPELIEQVIRVVDAAQDPEIMQIVSQALSDKCAVEIQYVNNGGECSTRTIEPLTIFSERDAWYVIGWCHLKETVRHFRIDRISEARLIPTIASREFDIAALTVDGLRALDTSNLPIARLRFHNASDYVERDWPGSRRRPKTASFLDVDVPCASTAWVARKALSMLDRIEVMFPKEMQLAVAAAAQEQLSNLL